MTVVKICGIAGLDQALWALEAGADQLGFVLAPGRRQLAPEAMATIVQAARSSFPPDQHPWQAVGVYANQPLEFVLKSATGGMLDIIQLSGRETPEYCRQLSWPVYKAIHLPGLSGSGHPGSPLPGKPGIPLVGETEGLAPLGNRYGAARILLDSGGAGRWGGTGESFSWELIGRAARDCLVAGGLNPGNVGLAIDLMGPWGVDVSSGVEREGRKDRELIRAFITEVRRSDDHGHVE